MEKRYRGPGYSEEGRGVALVFFKGIPQLQTLGFNLLSD